MAGWPHHLSRTHREARASLEEHGTALRLQRCGRRAVHRPRAAPLRGYGYICYDKFLGILQCAVLCVATFDARGRKRLGLLSLLLPGLVQVAPHRRRVQAPLLVELAQVSKVTEACTPPQLCVLAATRTVCVLQEVLRQHTQRTGEASSSMRSCSGLHCCRNGRARR